MFESDKANLDIKTNLFVRSDKLTKLGVSLGESLADIGNSNYGESQ